MTKFCDNYISSFWDTWFHPAVSWWCWLELWLVACVDLWAVCTGHLLEMVAGQVLGSCLIWQRYFHRLSSIVMLRPFWWCFLGSSGLSGFLWCFMESSWLTIFVAGGVRLALNPCDDLCLLVQHDRCLIQCTASMGSHWQGGSGNICIKSVWAPSISRAYKMHRSSPSKAGVYALEL